MTSFPVSSVDYEHMFELAPVSLWLEDYSALRQLFTRWRAEGVSAPAPDLVQPDSAKPAPSPDVRPVT